ncbi:MAG: hypothetical protein IPO47_03335 [Bacteroidetes bacterium]|nr:hypothetical protein [Bacteroidota bacterium]
MLSPAPRGFATCPFSVVPEVLKTLRPLKCKKAKGILPLTISNIMEMKTEYVDIFISKAEQRNGSVTMSVSTERLGACCYWQICKMLKVNEKRLQVLCFLIHLCRLEKSLKDNFRTDMVDSANKMKELESQLQRF